MTAITEAIYPRVQGRAIPGGEQHDQPMKDVATAYGVGPEALRNWLVRYREARRHGGGSDGLGTGPVGGAQA